MEQQTVNLKQCIGEVTGKQIAMDGNNFIYLDDMSNVSDEIIALAKEKQELSAEKQRVETINKKAGELIEAKYPIYKQLNINSLLVPYVEADRHNMKIFIENIREISNTAIANGTLLEDINWL